MSRSDFLFLNHPFMHQKKLNHDLGLSSSKGFTLIELLVVIAIIGILSAVVLASLSNSRGKAYDARIKSELKSLTSAAELQYSSLGCYAAMAGVVCSSTVPPQFGTGAGTGCPATGSAPATTGNNARLFYATDVLNLIAAARVDGVFASCAADVGGQAYAVAVRLKSDLALAWCVDSTGVSKQLGTAGGTALTQTSLNALIVGYRCV